MNFSEYKSKLNKLKLEFASAKNKLHTQYALSQNKIKIGDLITDHIGSIEVQDFSFYINYNDIPSIKYVGVMFTKKGNKYKSGERRVVFKENIIENE